jgi:aspartyl-tRNA(Asn)/glutamyl-tRNA(Gln) amidotransferase subunit B
MVGEKAVSQSAAKDVLAVLAADGGDPQAIVEQQGLGRAGEDELAGIVERAIEQQADAVEKIKAGNDKAIGAIVGAVMKETKGRADGGEVQRMIRERIGT